MHIGQKRPKGLVAFGDVEGLLEERAVAEPVDLLE
jgi:hypothetical protein